MNTHYSIRMAGTSSRMEVFLCTSSGAFLYQSDEKAFSLPEGAVEMKKHLEWLKEKYPDVPVDSGVQAFIDKFI